MIKWLYNEFGFFGTGVVSSLFLLLFVLWIAGLAGIGTLPDAEKSKKVKMLLAIFIPPYPMIWLVYDIFRQKKALRSTD